MTAWRNRIIGVGEEAPDQLLANPRNWRIHPKAQQDVLSQALNEVGWVTGVIVNQRSGCVVDGHLRVSLALSRGETAIPVQYVDLDDREEGIVLASLDPVSAMAGRDDALLSELVSGLELPDGPLADMLAGLAGTMETVPESGEQPEEQWMIVITCEDELQQAGLLERFEAEGLKCRALLS